MVLVCVCVSEGEILWAYLAVFFPLLDGGTPVIIRVLVGWSPYLEGLFGSQVGGDCGSEHIVCAGQFSVFANRPVHYWISCFSFSQGAGWGGCHAMLGCSGFVHSHTVPASCSWGGEFNLWALLIFVWMFANFFLADLSVSLALYLLSLSLFLSPSLPLSLSPSLSLPLFYPSSLNHLFLIHHFLIQYQQKLTLPRS